MAERHAALHAAPALVAQAVDRQRVDELAVVADPLARVALGLAGALDLEEAAELAHYAACSVATKPSPPVDSPGSIAWPSCSASSASARL